MFLSHVCKQSSKFYKVKNFEKISKKKCQNNDKQKQTKRKEFGRKISIQKCIQFDLNSIIRNGKLLK